jgi:hypothetical protein
MTVSSVTLLLLAACGDNTRGPDNPVSTDDSMRESAGIGGGTGVSAVGLGGTGTGMGAVVAAGTSATGGSNLAGSTGTGSVMAGTGATTGGGTK